MLGRVTKTKDLTFPYGGYEGGEHNYQDPIGNHNYGKSSPFLIVTDWRMRNRKITRGYFGRKTARKLRKYSNIHFILYLTYLKLLIHFYTGA